MADGGAGSIDAGAAMNEHRFGEFVEKFLHRLQLTARERRPLMIHRRRMPDFETCITV
jgi:hypothetical protein